MEQLLENDLKTSPERIAIEVEKLRVIRGTHVALSDVCLRVRTGTVTGILGPSGCGKTTLMRSIVGVQLTKSGRVEVLGHPAGDAALRKRIGYVTQAPSVYRDLTVRENLWYFARLVRASNEKIEELLETVGLSNRAAQVVDSLSGGERSRVSLATALLQEPDLLVLDEPTVGLDPVLRAELWKTFRALATTGTTLMISSHVMEEAEECDDLVLMRAGNIIRQTTPSDLRASTGRETIGQAFLAIIEAGT